MSAPSSTNGSGRPSAPASERSLWIGMSVILLGTIMVVLDTTIVNVALPQIADALNAGDGVEWIVSAYLLAVAVSLPITGWVSDRFGHKRVYLLALAAFTLASLACALSPSLPVLVVFRVLQGLGGGALMPVGMAIVLKMFPRERHGRAIGVWGIAAMAAPAVGPTLGGWLVTSVNWHWLFLINVPIGAVAIVAGLKLLPEVPRDLAGRFDLLGFVTGSFGLALLVLGLSEANNWGWTTAATILCIGGGAVLMVLFVVHELHTDQPMLEMRMFRHPAFSMAFGITFLVVTAQYARLVFIPLDLEGVRGYSALEVGLMLAPAGLATAVGMNSGGRLADRIGTKLPMIVGTSLMAVALLGVATFGLSQPLWLLSLVLVVQGFGMGLHAAPATVTAMNTLTPELLGQGSAMRTLTSQVAGAMSVAGLSAVLSVATPADPSPAQTQDAFSSVFYVAFAGMVGAIVLALLIKPVRAVSDEARDELEAVDEAAFALVE
jgi:EmrB/QacA subfamily drug resistance transporter